jgi:hypothetical protein
MLFQANELFQIKVDENAVFPLNLIFDYEINANETLNQPGIFFMLYKGELIYIGYAIQQEALDRMHPIDCDIPRKCNALKTVLKPRCNQEGLLQGDYVELVKKLNL